jgi:hypothetical protein
VVHFSTTPPYGAATPAADVLAWGRVVMFTATGHPRAADMAALPADLRPVVAGCLGPDPVARPSARALLTELLTEADLSAGVLAAGARHSRLARGAPAPAAPAPADEPPPRRGRSGAVLWAAACVACLVAIAAAAFFILGRHPGTGTPKPRPASPGRSPATTALPIPLQVNGIWVGTIHQTNPTLDLAVRLSLPGGGRHGTLTYPQIGCTGRLALTSAARSLLTFHLAITSGQSNCVPGVVRLAVHGNTLAFTFVRHAGGSNPAGTLTRAP